MRLCDILVDLVNFARGLGAHSFCQVIRGISQWTVLSKCRENGQKEFDNIQNVLNFYFWESKILISVTLNEPANAGLPQNKQANC